MAPSHEVQFVDLFNLEMSEVGGPQLFSDFAHRVRRMKRRDEVALQHRWSVRRMLVYQSYRFLVTGGPQKIDKQDRRARLSATGGRAPQRDRIGKMVQQAVAEDGVKLTRFDGGVREVSLFQRDSLVQAGLANMTLPETEHDLGTVYADRGHAWKRAHKADHDIRGPAAQLDDATRFEVRKTLAKVAGNLAMGFAPIGSRIGRRLLLLIHQLRFSDAFH
jgi:hypothetical protein